MLGDGQENAPVRFVLIGEPVEPAAFFGDPSQRKGLVRQDAGAQRVLEVGIVRVEIGPSRSLP
jgi:hypothetical protein